MRLRSNFQPNIPFGFVQISVNVTYRQPLNYARHHIMERLAECNK